MPKLLKNEGIYIFLLVWLGQLVCILGASISNFSLNIWIYQQSNSVSHLSFLILLNTIPLIVISPFAGVLVDRWNRRLVMILSNFATALNILVLIILVGLGKLQIWHIYLVTVLNSSFNAFQYPAYNAAITLLIPKKYLGRASGMTQLAMALGQLIAPLVGALLLGYIKLSGIFILDFLGFLFALTVLLLVRFPKIVREREVDQTSLLKQAFASFNYLKTRYGLLALSFFIASNNFLVGILQVLVYPLILSFSSPAQLGLIGSIGGTGMLAGSIVMSIWGNKQQNYIKIIFLFMVINAFATILTGLYPSFLLLAIAAFIFFFTLPFINSSTQVIFQTKVAPHLQGRVFAFTSALYASCLPLACLISGPLADKVFEPLMTQETYLAKTIGHIIGTGAGRGIALMFIVFGLINIIITIVAHQYSPLRLLERELADAY